MMMINFILFSVIRKYSCSYRSCSKVFRRGHNHGIRCSYFHWWCPSWFCGWVWEPWHPIQVGWPVAPCGFIMKFSDNPWLHFPQNFTISSSWDAETKIFAADMEFSVWSSESPPWQPSQVLPTSACTLFDQSETGADKHLFSSLLWQSIQELGVSSKVKRSFAREGFNGASSIIKNAEAHRNG